MPERTKLRERASADLGASVTYTWRVRKNWAGEPLHPERFGQPCRVIARGRKNSVLVEFADGYRVVTSRWSVRRVTT